MEGFLFVVDMVCLILLLRAVITAEKAGKQYIDSGFFAFHAETGDDTKKRKGGVDA